MNCYFDVLLKLANKAYKRNEVPVGAIVVFNNKIIAKAYNKRTRNHDITSHAEIIAIKKAAKKIGDWRLNDCDIYVNLEPCSMCKEVIKQSRIANVYYLIDKYNYKKEYAKTNFKKVSEKDYSFQQKKYRELLSKFFKLKCKR
ncbi:MAG: nucleoside deaminase [Erysipelotrichales bacterium]|nr:nucleoside deaminase [Erysipelotrichales bacterium]